MIAVFLVYRGDQDKSERRYVVGIDPIPTRYTHLTIGMVVDWSKKTKVVYTSLRLEDDDPAWIDEQILIARINEIVPYLGYD